MLDRTEIQNILALIAKANITGNEATTVALLQQKLVKMGQDLEKEPEPKKEEKGSK